MKHAWVISVLDCSLGMKVWVFANIEAEGRKKLAEYRREGVPCGDCDPSGVQPVKHRDLQVKKER